MENTKKALKRLCLLIVLVLAVVAFAVWFFDPFYQYHAPFFGMEPVFNDRDNQMPGSIRNLKYDSILVGSSVAENFDTDYLNEVYQCDTLKVIKASGSMPDLLYYVELAQKNHDLKNVFWCLDLFAMDYVTEVELFEQGAPKYLHTQSPLDDLPYLYNKEILLEKIPTWVVSSWQGVNTGGMAYNWAEGKVFSAEAAISHYERYYVAEEDIQVKSASEYRPIIDQNISSLTEQVKQHPETQYFFLLPPYSMLWWDCAYVNGELEEKIYIMDQIFTNLLPLENVEIYSFQNDPEIVCDLNHYMDKTHYSPEINQYMLEQLGGGDYRITPDNEKIFIESMRMLAERIVSEEIYRYFEMEPVE